MPQTTRHFSIWIVPAALLLLFSAIGSSASAADSATAPASAPASAPVNREIALTPPMGWNSWNIFRGDIDEEQIKGIVDAMVERGLRDAGYVYVVLDDNWMEGRRDPEGRTARDENGNLQADEERFPSGMKALADYIHAKGMKFGIYGDRGTTTCMRIPESGSAGNELRDARTWASWDVDYLKYDNCAAPDDTMQADYERMRDALAQVERPIVYSICGWRFEPWMPQTGNLWRTTHDIGPAFKDHSTIRQHMQTVLMIVDQTAPLHEAAGPGHWNDPDMLEVGNLGDRLVEGEYTEDRTHFGLWAMMAAPLFIGTDLRTAPQEIIDILTNEDVIAIDQDPLGIQGRRVRDYGETEVFMKPLADGSKAVLVLNRTEEPREIIVDWADIEVEGAAMLHDVWEDKDLGAFEDNYTAGPIPGHGSQILIVKQDGRQ